MAPDASPPRRAYRYYDLVMAAFVTVLLCANLIGASKVASLWGFTFGAGVLFFPISYVFGDVLTEVYGYARARKVVWAGFSALIFASFMSWAILAFPPAAGWEHQAAFETVFSNTWRIVLASLTAYFCGEFCNSYVLAKMKLWTGGAPALEPDHRLHHRGRGGRLADLLPPRLPWRLAERPRAPRPPGQLSLEGRLGGGHDTPDLQGRELPQAGRERGLLRPRYELHSFFA